MLSNIHFRTVYFSSYYFSTFKDAKKSKKMRAKEDIAVEFFCDLGRGRQVKNNCINKKCVYDFCKNNNSL